MNCVKVCLLVLAYFIGAIIAIPCIILAVISCAVIYGVLKIEKRAIKEVDDDELNYVWDRLCDSLSELIYDLRDIVLGGIGL